MGYFHALKLAFLSSLIRKYMLWEGFYHDFSTKKVSASGGFAPWPPPRGSAPGPLPGGAAPWTPEVTSPPLTIYPGAAPVLHYYIEYYGVSRFAFWGSEHWFVEWFCTGETFHITAVFFLPNKSNMNKMWYNSVPKWQRCLLILRFHFTN